MLWGEAGCWMCLSQEGPAKGGGSGTRNWVPLGMGKLWAGSSEGQRGLGGQGGECGDGCPREKGRNLSGLRKNPWLPSQHPDSSPCMGWQGFTSSCPAASQPSSLHTHCSWISERKHSALFTQRELGATPSPLVCSSLHGRWPWLQPPVAQEQESLGTEHHHWSAQASLGSNKWGQKQLPLSKLLLPSPRALLHCRVFKRWWLLFHRGWQQIDSVTAASVRDLNPPLIDMTYCNGFFGYLSSHCVLRKL